MADKIKMDAPFLERAKGCHGARQYGGVPLTFYERSLDTDTASIEQVALAASNEHNVQMATMVMQNRDVNMYNMIYFVGPKDGFPLKIGISDQPWQRINGLQTGNWEKLILHGGLWTNGASYLVEQAAHRLAKKSGILERGEWVWATLVTAVDLVIEAAKEQKQGLFTPAMVVHNQGMAMLARDKAIANGGKPYRKQAA